MEQRTREWLASRRYLSETIVNIPVSGLLGRITVHESSSRGVLMGAVMPRCGSVVILDRRQRLDRRQGTLELIR